MYIRDGEREGFVKAAAVFSRHVKQKCCFHMEWNSGELEIGDHYILKGFDYHFCGKNVYLCVEEMGDLDLYQVYVRRYSVFIM